MECGEGNMGNVVAFRPRGENARRRPALAPGASAEILFFTGVRYERHVDVSDASQTARPRDGSGSPGGTPAGAGAGKRRA